MADKAWKRAERQVAGILGGERQPNNGRAQADVLTPLFAVEHKSRRTLPAWLTRALRQASAGAEGRMPLVVLTEARQGVKARRYALLTLDDLAALAPRDPGVSAPCVRPSHYHAIDVPITALTADPRLHVGDGEPCVPEVQR
jgi:hypothetical protein